MICAEDIWQIREVIEVFENVKDCIIAYLEKQITVDSNTGKMWISDIKEAYYSVIAAWQLLSSAGSGETQNLTSAKSYLQAAEAGCAQSISELKIFKTIESDELIGQLERVFADCFQAISTQIERLAPPHPGKTSGASGTGEGNNNLKSGIIEVSPTLYRLPCAVCGQVAVEFTIGSGRFDKAESLIYSGITHSSWLKKELAEGLFVLLAAGDTGRAHAFMKKHHSMEGIDAYCPQCKKIYCKEHYRCRETYDEGFYDCTYGTCPRGHERIIHD